MRVRLSIIVSLMLALAMIVQGRQLTAKDDPPAGQEKRELTPEEEREALDLAARFTERLRATSDFGQIVDEMFVQSFPERLRQAPRNAMPWAFLDKSLAGSAGPDEARRYYVAMMNFYELYFRLYEVVWQLKKQPGSNADEEEPMLEEVLSPEIIEALLGNPISAGWVKEEENDEREKEGHNNGQLTQGGDSTQAARAATEADNEGAKEADEDGVIKSVSQLKDTSATLEKANELMRKRLSYMPVIAPKISGYGGEEARNGSEKPNLTSLDEGEFGYPAGTPVIHLDVLPYCLDLISVDGRLRILSVSLYVD